MKQQILELELNETLTFENTTTLEQQRIRNTCFNIKRKYGKRYKVSKSGNDTIVVYTGGTDSLKNDLDSMNSGDVAYHDIKSYDSLRTYSKKHNISVSKVVKVTKL